MRLFTFRKKRPYQVPWYNKKNVRIEIVGPLNQVLFTVDFINPGRALDMLKLLLEDHSYMADGPFKLNYYRITTGVAIAETTTELGELPPNTEELFRLYDCGL